MIGLLLSIPIAAAAASFAPVRAAMRRAILVIAAAAHTALTAQAWLARPVPAPGAWLGIDDASLLFLSVTSALFLAASISLVGYLAREAPRHADFEEEGFFTNSPEARFVGCLLLFLATMTLVAISRHFGLLWVAIEATTLASAPLIYFHRHHRSLEATWKYLLICSVGIALALLGNFFLAVAAKGAPGPHLTAGHLLEGAAALNPIWLKGAFLLLLVGYGTKMGLAPMHNWLPDAHSEAPSGVSALLSGALLNCAFLGILRAHSVVAAAGLGDFSRPLLILFGLLSMGVAALFMIEQTDYKRLLAYSSVEHMGVLALGAGIGGLAGGGAMLHAVNHSLAKAMLFLLAGNILAAYRTKNAGKVSGLTRGLPATGALWIAGFLAIAGSPPFGLFNSELMILKGALQSGRYAIAAGYLLALGIVFAAMSKTVLAMCYGRKDGADCPLDSTDSRRADKSAAIAPPPHAPEPAASILPPLALGAVSLTLGLYVPQALWQAIAGAARLLGVD
ncbi:MAG: Hydrogenase-4 component B [candidate division BRC1 bacterium ADurb.BinA364]|nr:MAG: Hydrogenase-4 component B [candidate division BRC1 bacterium ADurb.BinA364]